ncbi:carboxypeptidase regulatory-like domain-containing protein [Thaumasiovibrio subtropicus]|uniref:carboxypeptidase regulatory-like domain-containing protein n=1 Tax=Thaumasiovibrio subtropicus TaxID=1891207 RepID=UPI000B361520|nr:carboxypeptidase regulatory-like domain-containing protein [Thaumasiovibrio subtropicus]
MIRQFRYAWFFILLAGCGGGGGDGGSGNVPDTVVIKKGVFVDSPVQGLSYVSGDTSGTTSATGEFEYEDGKTVTFSLGDVELGSANGGAVITPIDIVEGATDSTNPKVTNIIRLLQTADADGDPSNGITLEKARLDALPDNLDLDQAIDAFDRQQALMDWLADQNLSLVDVNTAREHFDDILDGASKDSDNDGIPDAADIDRDGDGVNNNVDRFPDDGTESQDLDGDGIGDNADPDRDGDEVNDDVDIFPNDPNESADLDSDGIGDNSDPDRDGDNVNNDQDRFPNDPNESADLDNDGIGDNADPDRDNDGVNDETDRFPNDPNESADLDNDGIGDNSDPDRDGDGVENGVDVYPDDPARSALPTVTIDTPETLATVGATPITVTGSVDAQAASLTLNGVNLALDGSGSYSADVALEEGLNTIVARIVSPSDEGDIVSTASISVSLDLTPPTITLESHTDGDTVTTETVTITGLINDIVRGTIEEDQASLTLNGEAASISNRSYAIEGVALNPGQNDFTLLATDQVGNQNSLQFSLNYSVPTGQRIELVSGQAQIAEIETQVEDPLTVRVLDNDANPVANASVVFRVEQGSGVVGVGTDDAGRAVVVDTNAEGVASTQFQVGARVGTANHKVKAQAVGYDDELIFTASGTSALGNKLSVNSGNNQRGATYQALPAPFVTVVTDSGANVVSGARVEYKVIKGGGAFGDDGDTVVVTTDSDGRVSVIYTLGDLEGLDQQRIVATLLDSAVEEPITAGFTASAFTPTEAGDTSISGVVLDNQDNPIPGATVTVEGTTRQATTDEQGQFTITEAPVGPVHLIVDGSTTSLEGEYPTLSYNIVTISGIENPLAAPVYMVKLDVDSGVEVGPSDVSLTLEEYPGFQLDVAKDSVTFPDGARSGLLSVTAVNASKVPMAPPNGMQPQFIVTIQPTGTRFDPPARLTLPNVDGHSPGAQVEMYSYDHDLEEFVSIGLGTVSEDGALVQSNPGVGVIKAGWHCGSQPGGSGCTYNCGECQTCDDDCNCINDDSQTPRSITDVEGDCKSPACQDGSAVQVNDDSDTPPDNECKICEDGAVTNREDGRVNACLECEDGEEKKVPDNEIGSTSISFAGVTNFIKDVNKILDLLGSDDKIPEVQFAFAKTEKEVCCVARDGEMTDEIEWKGSVVFPGWSGRWRPTIPPYSGDYTITIFGRSIGVAYGVQFEAGFTGSVDITRTERECQGDDCWGGSVGGQFTAGGGLFGEVPNPALPPECGPRGNEDCAVLRVEGTVTSGFNIQAGVNCEKINGKIGHTGIAANAKFIVAEGTWVETAFQETLQLVNSGSITVFEYELPD